MTILDEQRSATDFPDPLRAVDPRAYTDDALFERERDRIFRRVWQFACHESELPEAGSFFTTEVAGAPIIVNRDAAGAVRAHYNVCRHRGAEVVGEESGSCRQFRCPYHAWVYDLDGSLVGVPGTEAYDYPTSGFSKERFGLVPVRCESAHGLVFVCLDPAAPALSSFLGNAMPVLERFFGTGELEVIHQTRYPMHANWKLYPENSRDGYHVPFLHKLFRSGSPPRQYALLDNGHTIQYLGVDQGDMSDEEYEAFARDLLPGLHRNEGFAMQIWPHLLILARNNFMMIESVHPVAAGETAMQGRVLGVRGDASDVRDLRMASWSKWADIPNRGEDLPVIESQQRALRSGAVPFILLNRGADNVEGVRGDDNRVRQFWQVWRDRLDLPLNSPSGDFRPTLPV